VSVWLVLLYGISARQIVGPLGAVGTPAMLLAMFAAFVWLCGFVLPDSGLSREPHPMRPALLVYLWYGGCSFAIAMSRPLTELEYTGVVRALITLTAQVGIALLIADGIRDVERLKTLLRRVVSVGTFLALIGILQFFSGRDFTILIPGLRWLGSGEVGSVSARSIFNRPFGTALHPIELGVVTAALLPLSIHFGFYSASTSARRNAFTCAAVIAFAIPLSVSRSGVVSLVVGLSLLVVGWAWRRRLQALVVAGVAVPLLWMLVPGIVGTLRSMFTQTENDPSVQARIDRIPRIMEIVRERPWFGRGNGTWSTEDYFLVDNELWVSTIELGIVGVTMTFALIGLGIFACFVIYSSPTTDEATAHLAKAVAASIGALGISILTFDAFFYQILTGTLFLLLGSVGALWRLERPIARTTTGLARAADPDSSMQR
jgi:polysaccharide biosynthesis protein PslJ